jgi:hypothetical protein
MARHLLSEVNPLLSNAQLTTLGETQAVYQVSVKSSGVDRLILTGVPSLPLSSPVKVTQADGLWLGEVIQSGAAETIIEIIHSLGHLRELSGIAEDSPGAGQPERALLS